MVDLHERALGAIEEVFGDRLRRRQPGRADPDGALASVFPANAEEVALLARITDDYSLPLSALGAETTPEKQTKEGRVLIRFDLMRNLWLSDANEPLAEAEPGALWLELDNDLRIRGQGLTVYPTSAPRATIGGWLAQDGVGVGSFEYGRLNENVVSADVVMPDGARRTVGGDDLHLVVGSEKGIVVHATLQTRRAENDKPYALAFGDSGRLAASVADIFREGVPLWHLAFLSPEMARLRGLGQDHLLFGAYPGGRGAAVEKALRDIATSAGGRVHSAADAYRAWGERFFPIAPAHPTPVLTERAFIRVGEIPAALKRHPNEAVQGTVSRSGEVLLLAFDPSEGSPEDALRPR
jgi:FAD/FMN-containing dehydrogenase